MFLSNVTLPENTTYEQTMIFWQKENASLYKGEFENINIKRVYENVEDRSECPVIAFEIYLFKIFSLKLQVSLSQAK